MLFVSRGYFESDFVREPEWFSHLQDILERLLGHQVAISFGYVFAIFGLYKPACVMLMLDARLNWLTPGVAKFPGSDTRARP